MLLSRLVGGLLAALVLVTAAPSHAAFTRVKHFAAGYPDGQYPVGAPLLYSSNLYGFTTTNSTGAATGGFYKQALSGGVTLFKDFDYSAPNIVQPNAGPVQGPGSTFYATCLYGGANNYGMVFAITASGTATEIFSFTNNPATDGAYPYSGVSSASNGKLYGTAFYGGAANIGIIYSVDPVTHALSIVHSFAATGLEGYYPVAGVCEGPDHRLYGTTYRGGAQDLGVVYRCDLNGSNFTVLHEFTGTYPSGWRPCSDLVRGPAGGASANKLFGTCIGGGANSVGTVFSVDTTTGAVATVCDFDGYNGANPGNNTLSFSQSRLTAPATGTTIYGATTRGGPNGLGTIFKLDTATGVCTLIAELTMQAGYISPGPLALSGTTLYGTSHYGGITATVNAGGATGGYGGSFSCTLTGTLKLTHSWYVPAANQPVDTMTPFAGGVAYGTDYSGGLFGNGAIYKLTAAGVYTEIHQFNNYAREGAAPEGGLIKARDGALYGTTTAGGFYGNGTLFKCTVSGTLTVLHHFNTYEGSAVYQKLVQGPGTDNNLYGVGWAGGATDQGSIFLCSTTGKTFRVLHHFTGYPDGARGACQLTPDVDGSGKTILWGGTAQGGAYGQGVLFRVFPGTKPAETVYTRVHDLDGANGSQMYFAGQMRLISGSLYGMTWGGGVYGHGTVFRYTPSTDTFVVLHHFNNGAVEGYQPVGGLSPDSANFYAYGACYGGGSDNMGTIWKMDLASGALTVLHSFGGTALGGDGQAPFGAVYDPTTGLVWGPCYYGGNQNVGLLWNQTTTP